MPNVISQYYQGIVQQLRSEVDSINSLFQHQGMKGGGNESALRDLLTKFIPKRFGIGTGVVIDRNGTQSRQCDIVIYDTMLYPSLLSLTNVHFFPIDIVYATIEIKTNLTSGSVKEALTNIASVKQLDFINDQFTVTEVRNGGFSVGTYTPQPPLGFIFAYNSNTQQFETFKNWLTPTTTSEVSIFPSAVGCLDQGLVLLWKDKQLCAYPEPGTQPKGWMLPLFENPARPFEFMEARENFTHNGHVYPVKKITDKYVVVDQGRTLLIFLLILQEMLSVRRINPGISFLNTYFVGQTIDAHYEI